MEHQYAFISPLTEVGDFCGIKLNPCISLCKTIARRDAKFTIPILTFANISWLNSSGTNSGGNNHGTKIEKACRNYTFLYKLFSHWI